MATYQRFNDSSIAMSREEFAEIAAVLSAGVVRSLDVKQLRVWYEILKDLPADDVRKAVKRYLMEAEYPGLPPIGKIRKLATEAGHGVPELWAQALEHVLHLVRTSGSSTRRCTTAVCGTTSPRVRGIPATTV